MITTTLGALAQAEPALERLAGERVPFAVAHRIAKLRKAVGEETKHFHDQRNALVKEYGEVKPGGQPDEIQVGPTMATWPTFIAKVEELAAVPVEIALAPIELTRIEKLEIAAADLLLLGPLVALEEAPATTTVPA